LREYTDFPFKRQPMEHQYECWKRSRDLEYFALFMDMGSCKSKIVVDTAAYLHMAGKIQNLLIIAPKGVYRNWLASYDDAGAIVGGEVVLDLPSHIKYIEAFYDAKALKADRDKLDTFMEARGLLRVLCINVESLTTDRGGLLARDFLMQARSMMVVDESSCIKHDSAKRTKVCQKLGTLAQYRRILCGNWASDSPFDIYSQADFLKPRLLGGSFFGFKNYVGKMQKVTVRAKKPGEKDHSFMKCEGYRNLDKLKEAIKPWSFAIRKDECMDLPPKVPLPARMVYMQDEQLRVYKEMKKFCLAEIEKGQQTFDFDETTPDPLAGVSFEQLANSTPIIAEPGVISATASAQIVLTQMMRLQQIACGFVVDDEGNERDLWTGSNPRIDAMMEALEELTGKAIIWSHFTRSINEICAALAAKYGPESVVRYDGQVKDGNLLERAKREFQDPESPVRFFVGNQHKGGMGITLTEAEFMLYYSNDCHNSVREQSEDRAHRKGLKHSVSYQDLVAWLPNGAVSIDQHTLNILKGKKSISDMMRDGSWREIFK